MTLYDIYQLFVQATPPLLIIVILVLSLIEFTPIKINPLRAIGKAIAKGLNGETNDKIDEVKNSFSGKITTLDEAITNLDEKNELRMEVMKEQLQDQITLMGETYTAKCDELKDDYNRRCDEIHSDVRVVTEQLNEHVREAEIRELKDRRQSLLDFASAISGGRNYTRERYEQMLIECDDYENYCEKKKFKNSVAMASIAIIKRTYEQHLAQNDFLATAEYDEFYNAGE